MDMMEQVLRAVQTGEQRFQPDSDSAEDIKRFQAEAEAVIYAHHIGYLRDCKPRMDATSLGRHYINVMVAGLTHPGREFLADVDRQNRVIPEVLTDALYGIATSGDKTVDDLLLHAINAFRSPEPANRRVAVEKLWDAWERLKTLLDANPSVGNKMLLDVAADEKKFRELLEHDAKQLRDAGNDFHIRHFKTAGVEIVRIEQYDYLFHRLFALVNLLLVSLKNETIGRMA
jgi:hypothetical protein